jgi:hypothetical protein
MTTMKTKEDDTTPECEPQTSPVASASDDRMVWEELLDSPESRNLLTMMGVEAAREYREGKTQCGGWGD